MWLCDKLPEGKTTLNISSPEAFNIHGDEPPAKALGPPEAKAMLKPKRNREKQHTHTKKTCK